MRACIYESLHSKDIENIKSEYQIALYARRNYELTMRKYRGSRFLTKITKANKESLLTDNFYQEVINDYPLLKEIVPEYVGSLEMDGLYYLATEFFESPTTEEVISAIENID